MLAPEPSWKGPRVFLDFSISGQPIGRVIIELYSNECPKACENFRQMCTGEYRPRGIPIGYKDTQIHRVVPGFILQGGDADKRDGTGCISIYGYTFEDENSGLSMNEAGVVAMANSGKDSNGCQFFITLSPLKELDGNYVAFGKVISGMYTLRQIENVPLKPGTETPLMSVSVIECGEL